MPFHVIIRKNKVTTLLTSLPTRSQIYDFTAGTDASFVNKCVYVDLGTYTCRRFSPIVQNNSDDTSLTCSHTGNWFEGSTWTLNKRDCAFRRITLANQLLYGVAVIKLRRRRKNTSKKMSIMYQVVDKVSAGGYYIIHHTFHLRLFLGNMQRRLTQCVVVFRLRDCLPRRLNDISRINRMVVIHSNNRLLITARTKYIIYIMCNYHYLYVCAIIWNCCHTDWFKQCIKISLWIAIIRWLDFVIILNLIIADDERNFPQFFMKTCTYIYCSLVTTY